MDFDLLLVYGFIYLCDLGVDGGVQGERENVCFHCRPLSELFSRFGRSHADG